MVKAAINTPVTAEDRFGLTLVLAIIIHAILILGVSFDLSEETVASRSLDVTLASFKSEKKFDNKADYLAQFDQEGSGSVKEKSKPSSDLPAPFQDTVIQEVTLQKKQVMQSELIKSPLTPLVKADSSVNKANSDKKLKKVTLPEEDGKKEISELREDIASLEAAFYEQRELYAKRPVIKRLNMATTKKSPGALYMYRWRSKVTLVGNLNYPVEISQKDMYGELEMVVSIKKDGSLERVEVIKSSGYQLLDDAAVNIVKLSAPFDPFPVELMDSDIIEIIRTWRFEKGRISSG